MPDRIDPTPERKFARENAIRQVRPLEGDALREQLHASDCAMHNAPAYPAGPCDCQ